MSFENMSKEVAKGVLEDLLFHSTKRDASVFDLLKRAEKIDIEYKKQALELYQKALKIAIESLNGDISSLK